MCGECFGAGRVALAGDRRKMPGRFPQGFPLLRSGQGRLAYHENLEEIAVLEAILRSLPKGYYVGVWFESDRARAAQQPRGQQQNSAEQSEDTVQCNSHDAEGNA
jgi:hypothetical protein